MNVHFSSKTSEWETPQDLFDDLSAEFGGFDVDVCATIKNTKVPVFWTKETDGLSQSWEGLRCWMNPPYGREIGAWVKKASEGGGKDRGCAPASSYGYQVVPHVYLSEAQRGNPLLER